MKWVGRKYLHECLHLHLGIHKNAFPDDKILDLSKFKTFTDDNVDVAQMVQFFFDRTKQIVGKGENAGYQLITQKHCAVKDNTLLDNKIQSLDLSKSKAFENNN